MYTWENTHYVRPVLRFEAAPGIEARVYCNLDGMYDVIIRTPRLKRVSRWDGPRVPYCTLYAVQTAQNTDLDTAKREAARAAEAMRRALA
jgi:hypothetical protein